MDWNENTGKKNLMFWSCSTHIYSHLIFISGMSLGSIISRATGKKQQIVEVFCLLLLCCFVTSRGQHELKVKWWWRQWRAQCHPGPSPCRYSAQRVCVLQLCLYSHPVCLRSLALAAVWTAGGLMWTFCGLIGILNIVCCSCFSVSSGLVALCCQARVRGHFPITSFVLEASVTPAASHSHLYLL